MNKQLEALARAFDEYPAQYLPLLDAFSKLTSSPSQLPPLKDSSPVATFERWIKHEVPGLSQVAFVQESKFGQGVECMEDLEEHALVFEVPVEVMVTSRIYEVSFCSGVLGE